MKSAIKAIPLVRSLYHSLKSWEYERRFSGDCYACFRGVYDNFEQAIATAPKTKSLGYNDPELAYEYKEELEKAKLRSYDYPVLFWLSKILEDGSRVFDFGGNVGIHFYLYARYLNYPVNLKWMVCDLKEIILAGKVIADREKNNEILFTEDFQVANGVDLFLASGSIQYVKSLALSLDKLSHKPKHLLINRLPIYQGRQFVTLQNGGKVFYPQYVFNQASFIESLQKLGYELIDIWEDLVDSCYIPFHPEQSVPFYHGLYLKSRI